MDVYREMGDFFASMLRPRWGVRIGVTARALRPGAGAGLELGVRWSAPLLFFGFDGAVETSAGSARGQLDAASAVRLGALLRWPTQNGGGPFLLLGATGDLRWSDGRASLGPELGLGADIPLSRELELSVEIRGHRLWSPGVDEDARRGWRAYFGATFFL